MYPLLSSCRQHPRLGLAFGLALVVALICLLRLGLVLADWHPPDRHEIEPWMTVGLIGRINHVNPRRIDQVAGLPSPGKHPYTIEQIAQMQGTDTATVIARIEAAITQLKSQAAP
ncbi:hypothetical protein KM176_14175 [Pseudooceanicola sp. CBS1P-1]|uniref:Uncharacterized protein n=1 Tax=Pseudooceanicola albus TaxID=2692189 RepID=A0A6L7G2T2_9RHOB|nr:MULTISPECIES: hypothetical protein [Pseudooceanicola]MBT9385014.1 hypothetical protein [Pseudooceanicola endophyticus]MXN17992.1 hypothetical protein [Pseudooceanicola albus]